MTYRSNITDKEKFEHICNLTTSLVGLRKGSLAFKSRKQEIQLPRLVASNIARLSGIHQRAIAEVLKRDRSLIYHYENTHSANYTSWREYRKMFNLVYKAYEEIEDVKPAFIDRKGMKQHLLEFVEESEPYQVEILITSGVVGCKIRTSFIKFSYVLKNLKFALANYNHSININLR
tara:strand:- start:633 stop:1160 length:528 start_codon:yes stop_codon:yes gene_type:complete